MRSLDATGEILNILTGLPRSLNVHAPQCAMQFINHSIEGLNECRPPSDQYIVVPRPHSHRRRAPYDLPQTTAHAISLDSVSDLFRYSEANTYGSVITPLEGLQYERGRRSLRAGCGGQEVRTLLQSFHGMTRAPAPGSGAEALAAARASGGHDPTAPFG